MILRGLVVLLVCMNLGVGLWWVLHRPPAAAAAPTTDAGVGGLALLGEAEATESPEQADLAGLPVPMPEQAACLSLGPFDTPARLRAAMAALAPVAARIQFREVQADSLRGYRVYLPAAASREDALASVRALAARGIRDYYVVTAGEQENTVSLGMFRDLANAEARRDEVAALGFQPRLEPRTERAAAWWIDLAADASLDWRATVGDVRGLEARPVPCEGAAPADPPAEAPAATP